MLATLPPCRSPERPSDSSAGLPHRPPPAWRARMLTHRATCGTGPSELWAAEAIPAAVTATRRDGPPPAGSGRLERHSREPLALGRGRPTGDARTPRPRRHRTAARAAGWTRRGLWCPRPRWASGPRAPALRGVVAPLLRRLRRRRLLRQGRKTSPCPRATARTRCSFHRRRMAARSSGPWAHVAGTQGPRAKGMFQRSQLSGHARWSTTRPR